MQYFSNFPKTLFLLKPASYQQPAEYVAITDITRNVRFKREILDNIVLYDTYNIKEGDTPEIVSEKLYDTPYYHWIIMLLNDRYDYVNDFPMPQYVFDRYIEKKYNQVQHENEPYLESVYGTDAKGLLVDIVRDGNSVDISGNIVLVNKQTQESITKPIKSVWYNDPILGMPVKRFLYTDAPVNDSYVVDLKTWRVNFGAIPDEKPVYAFDKELDANLKKAQIKVISKELLQVVLTNFKDLM